MSKYTPGPWRTRHWPRDGYMAVEALTWVSEEAYPSMVRIYPRYSVADGVTPHAVDEAEANARLIAVCPDLLAICQEIANDPKVDLVDSERRIRLYAAITKAMGELK